MSSAPPASGEPERHGERSLQSPVGYGKAAKRLSGWAANLLATALILVAGLALGRQVLEWWRADSLEVNGKRAALLPDQGDLGNPDRAHHLELGDIPGSIQRDVLTGNKSAAFAALRSRGQRAISEPIEPRGIAGPAEVRMLSHLGEQKPTASEPGRWEIYELDGPMLLVAGIQFHPANDRPAPVRRVVFWGLAVPQGAGYPEKEIPWSMFSYQPALGASEASATTRVPLPRSARVTLSLTADDGGSMIDFRASGDSATLSRQIEETLASDGWKPAGTWRQIGEAWQGRFEKSGQAAEVQWSSEAGDALVGVMTVSPAKP